MVSLERATPLEFNTGANPSLSNSKKRKKFTCMQVVAIVDLDEE